jgi:AraC-like DNA-binding protein
LHSDVTLYNVKDSELLSLIGVPEKKEAPKPTLKDAHDILRHQVAQLHFTGLTAKDIGRKIGKSEREVKNLLRQKNTKEYLTYLSGLRDEPFEKAISEGAQKAASKIQGLLEQYAPDALNKIIALVGDPAAADSVALKAAQDVLDRSGFASKKPEQDDVQRVELSQGSVVHLVNALKVAMGEQKLMELLFKHEQEA